MPPANPRKSSTSSARPGPPTRPRYLGIEVAGEHLPPSPAAWDSLLRRRLVAAGAPAGRLRLIRAESHRAIVEVDHRSALIARTAFNGVDTLVSPPLRLASVRTWGTLRGAKAWWRATPGSPSP